MKRIATTALLLLMAGAGPAAAQYGLGLYWDGCSADPHEQVKTFACDTNVGAPFVLYATIAVPVDVPQLVAATVVVDVWFWHSRSVPPWWQTALGQCRANAIGMSFDPPSLATAGCPDLWQQGLIMSVFAAQPHPYNPLAIRLNGGAVLPAGQEIHLLADGTELNVARIVIFHSKTTGTGSCGGCQDCAELVYLETKLQQPAGYGDYTVTNENTPGSNVAFWQEPWCIPVGTRNRTWGALKGFDR